MDLELLEDLALSADRDAVLARLLPGSPDHDYHRCLALQHRGLLDEAAVIVDAWPGRHGYGEALDRLRARQLLLRLDRGDDGAADEVRDLLGVELWHQPEAAEVDPTLPTRLPEGAFDGDALLDLALARRDLQAVTDEGLLELLVRDLDPDLRRALLGRLGHTAGDAVVAHVASDLAAKGSAGFGALAVHGALTVAQLHTLAARRPELRTHRGWNEAVLRRLQPPRDVDLATDAVARRAYLDALAAFVAELPPLFNSLKASVLWHRLDDARRRDAHDLATFATYLALPRGGGYLARAWIEKVRRDELADLGSDFRAITGLAPIGDDEELVRDYLHHAASVGDDLARFAPWLDRGWLDAERATAHLLLGLPGGEDATAVLGTTRAAALRERVELRWCTHNPTTLAADAAVRLDVDVKNVPELVVKVFRIDPLGYFQLHRREVGLDVDLDGLAASDEHVRRFDEPPLRRVRRQIDLPACARPGTYVIDLIGNGASSRAVITKGRLRQVTRLGAAGHVVTIVDESGRPCPGAQAFLGERAYVADGAGELRVPFSTAPGPTPMLTIAGDVATVQTLTLAAESCALTAAIHVEREGLARDRGVRALARLRLTVGDAPASLALLRRPTWELVVTDRHGVTSTRAQPLALVDDDAAVLTWTMPDDAATVTIRIRATIELVSEQRERELTTEVAVEVAAIHGTNAIEAIYLARTTDGLVVHALGKNGEPRARRPVTVSLTHRWTTLAHQVELATDADGRVELGALPGLARLEVTLGDRTRAWTFDDGVALGGLQPAPGADVVIPIPSHRTAAEVARQLSLVELRGGVPARHVADAPRLLEGGLAFPPLPAGDYQLRAPGLGIVALTLAAGPEIAGATVAATEILRRTPPPPVIARLDLDDAELAITIADATTATRVHVIATRFAPSPAAGSLVAAPPQLGGRADRARPIGYASGRELGDEYRYVLERRGARRFPGLQLERPSLLLHPWARRTTSTAVADARPGGRFAPAPAMSAMGYGGRGGGGGHADDPDAFASHDFLRDPPVLLANLVPDDDGVVRVPRAAVGAATSLTIVCDDPAHASRRHLALAEAPLARRDLRLQLALRPDQHARQRKALRPLRAGETLVIEDLATAQLHLLDSVAGAHAYLLSLRDDPTLREFEFVTRWHELDDDARRERYDRHACHELHLFLHAKDRPFFDAVVRPTLAHKRTKTFLDRWLLDEDLAAYLAPGGATRLNAVERALLAQRTDGDAAARLLADEVAVQPPDPAADAHLLDVLLGGATLDGGGAIGAAQGAARGRAEEQAKELAGPAFAAEAFAPPAAAPAKAKKLSRSRAADGDDLKSDLASRADAAPLFRAADRTQELAEHNWWHRTPADSGPEMITANRLWRDLARHRGGGFLSPALGLATTSFAEMMCALALTDLPFTAGAHAITPDGARLTVVAAASALAGATELVDGAWPPTAGGPPLVVGQNYVRDDDRVSYDDGEARDKYVDGAFAAGVVYTCQVVLANPSSARQRVAALVQIPRGSLPTGGARATQTIDVELPAYGTHGHEYAFYFPSPGSHGHFPVHVSRGEQLVAAAPGRTLEVVAGGASPDLGSWSHVSQHGTVAEVVAYLATANLAATDLDRVAWRLRERDAYDAILAALEARGAFAPTLWAYALHHLDRPRLGAWLRSLGGALLVAGPALTTSLVTIDAEDHGAYEHLEYAPLINARAHRLGARRQILNDGLAAQYTRFLDLVAHRPAPTSEDLLAATAYLLAQDQLAAALATLARVEPTALVDRLQHAYLAAYAACLTADLDQVRTLIAPWRDVPIERWRRRFAALAAMLAEVAGGDATVTDPRSRDQRHAEVAARQPTFELALDRDGLTIRAQHVAALELRFFELDVELLFSRQPFVQGDASRLTFIEPGHRVTLTPTGEDRLAWPAALRGRNVVVEAVAAGQRRAAVHYANELALTTAAQVGQLRVVRAGDSRPLAAAYVKVFARRTGGDVAFYKDGYTDLRGWFDYASLSTDDLDRVERFAVLVVADDAGSAIVEAAPPLR